MAALWNRSSHYIFVLWFLSFFFFFFFLFFPCLISVVGDWMSTILLHMVWPYSKFRMHVLNELAGNAGPKKSPQIRHLGTIAQLCPAISSQLRHILTTGKIVKQQYLRHMSSQYGELRLTSGWDPLASLGHPSKFERVSPLISVTAWYSSSEHQPYCGVEQRAPPVFSRAAITLGIGPHSSILYNTALLISFHSV